MIDRPSRSCLAPLALALALAASGAWAQGKAIFIGQVNPPISFNPINSGDIASQYDQAPIFDSLLDMVEPLKFLPKLADIFELKDSKTILIKINPKAAWTDGIPVTADDVAFTINLVANPKTETSVGNYIAPFDGLSDSGKLPEGQSSLSAIKIVDKKTLEIKLTKASDLNMIKEQFGVKLLILPKHVLKDVDPAKLSQDPFFQAPKVTSGAFKFVQYAKNQYVEYAKNEAYYRGAPKIDKLFIKIVPGANLAGQLQTGDIHFNTGNGIGLIPSSDYETVKKLPNVVIKEEANTGIQMVLFNQKTIPDPKVRQAIAYALDRKTLIDKLLKGAAESVDGPYTSINPYLNKKMALYTYDPEKAKKLLAEAGWKSSAVLELVVPIGNKDREQSANIIAQNLADVGIKTNLTKYDFPTIMAKGKKHEFDLLLIGNNFLIDPDGVGMMYSDLGALNFADYHNAEAEKLFQSGKDEQNPAKRKVIYDKVQEIWERDLPSLTLYSYHELMAYSKKLVVAEPRFFGTFYNVQDWDIK
jgi:peptide/nickel transport system substrate-binding protein